MSTVKLVSGAEITIREHDARIERNRARRSMVAVLYEGRRCTSSPVTAIEYGEKIKALLAGLEEV